jgi:hypothetical protein
MDQLTKTRRQILEHTTTLAVIALVQAKTVKIRQSVQTSLSGRYLVGVDDAELDRIILKTIKKLIV